MTLDQQQNRPNEQPARPDGEPDPAAEFKVRKELEWNEQIRQQLMATHRDRLSDVQEKIGYRFSNPAFLMEAILHPSTRDFAGVSYERLEFLGDAVLDLVVAESLFRRFPNSDEGELTRIKSAVVSRTALASVGRRLGITEQIVLGRGMEVQGVPPRSVTANCTEAIIGALYLDGGLEAARRFVHANFEQKLNSTVQAKRSRNHKSMLQQFTQSRGLGTPTYQVTQVSGPDHERIFEICAIVGGRKFEPSAGSSKKMAEQRAARNALKLLEAEEDAKASDDSPA